MNPRNLEEPGSIQAPDPRRASIVRAAKDAGARWAERQREALERDGRLPEGGWPGTLSEAKAIAASLRASGARQLTAEEVAWAARETYACAKLAWREWASELDRASRRRGSAPED